MNRRNFSHIGGRAAFTRTEAIAVVVVLTVLAALLIRALQTGRDNARRLQCTNNLKQIAQAVQNYTEANKIFPPGTICSTSPIPPSNQYDVWGEAGQTGTGFHGTGFLLRLSYFLECDSSPKRWDYHYGVGGNAVPRSSFYKIGYANQDDPYVTFHLFYCSSRRNTVRPGDSVMLLSPSWTGGGTDYGGCAGRHAAFPLPTGYNLCDATMFYEPNYYPPPFIDKTDDTPTKRMGIFGRVNVSTKPSEIVDGAKYTMMIGELQRITDITPTSKDGWAIGGPATLFTTGAMVHFDGKKLANVASPKDGALSNNHFWGSPGSEHVGGANYGMADGSVQFLSTSMSPEVFAKMGSMAETAK